MASSLPVIPNFPEIEHKWLEKWQKSGLLTKYLNKNKHSKTRFSFFDGPITANNPMGVHHGWGRTNKDLWQKYHNLLGDQLRFQNGFDCQGLWVEVEVEKELKLRSKKDIENLVPGDPKASIAKFVELCKERVYKYSKIQTEQSQRLGYFMDWDNSYFTMSSENNYMIWHFLKVCHENGWIYKGRESVPWCPRCETAISQHEMLTEDYKEVTHKAIYLELPLVDFDKEFLLIWTTTPWTIPANIAVAVDPKLEYSLVEGSTGYRFWVASALLPQVFGKENPKLIKTVKGKVLVGRRYRGPFDELPAVKEVAEESPKLFHTVVETDTQILPINLTEGTGLVHTAVSAGVEDFKLGKKLGLPMIPVIGDNADYLEGLGFLSGQNAKKHPEIILDYLEQRDQEDADKGGWVFKIEGYKHRYPACWRCKAELVWKVADEWFIAMDKPGKKGETLRSMMIKVAGKIKWIPSFGLDRELDWLNNMHDWLISKKNRYWGLSLPIYECEKCKIFQVIGGHDELKEKAVRGWNKFEGHTPHKPYIDEVVIKCDQCDGEAKRILDVGNPWLDAGIIPYATLVDPKTKKVSYLTDKKYWAEWFPADFITESFPGQFKNWFYSLIAMSSVLEETNPFKTVLGYATCVGADGRPMHKSWGNSIEFNEAAEKMGVDVMRWMYCRQDPKKNLLFGFNLANDIKRSFHIPLWNILNFFLTYSELDGFADKLVDPDKTKLTLLDSWLLAKLYATVDKVKLSLNRYQANLASEAIESLVLEASQWYLRLSRQRVWQNSEDKEDKLAFYSTLKYFLKELTILLSIFLPYFSEEIYSHLSQNQASVHLETFPKLNPDWENPSLVTDMTKLRQMAETGHIERKRNNIKVRQPLAQIEYFLDSEKMPELTKNFSAYQALLKRELNLKKVLFTSSKENTAKLDTVLTDDLTWEGKVRDLVRQVQKMRQEKGYKITDYIILQIPKVPEKYLEFIQNKVLASQIEVSDDPEVIITSEK